MAQPKNLNVTVSDIVFEEDVHGDKAQTSYSVCVNGDEKKITSATNPEQVSIDYDSLKTDDVVRIKVLFPNKDTLYGCISLNVGEYFHEQPCGSFTQWITIFDTADDDFFDGKLGEDDDEDPRVKVTFELAEAEAEPEPEVKAPVKKQVTINTADDDDHRQELPDANGDAQPIQRQQSQILDEADQAVQRLRTQRTQRQNQLQAKQGVKKQSTYKDAMNRRSTITGKQRGLSAGGVRAYAYQAGALSSLFGGNQKPRLATEKVDLRKEKQTAMDWIKGETKKYNVNAITQEIEMNIQSAINKVNKTQRRLQQNQNRQIRAVNKVNQLHDALTADKEKGVASAQRVEELLKSSAAAFEAFDEANKERIKDYQTRVEACKTELQTLEAQLDSNNKKNAEFEESLKKMRDAAKQDLTKGTDPEIEALKRQAEELLSANQKLRDTIVQKRSSFDKMLKEFENVIRDLNNKLTDADKQRVKAQNQAQKDQKDFFEATQENLRLKKLAFTQNMKVRSLGLQADQIEKRNKFLNLKQKGLVQDIDRVNQNQIKELKRVQNELNSLTSNVKSAQAEFDKNSNELDKLNSANEQIRSQNYEQQIEELENTMRKADRLRREAQYRLDQATGNWQAKVKSLTDPHADRAAKTADNVNKLKSLTDKLKEKFGESDTLRKRRDELMKQKHEQIGRTQLIEDYNKQADQLESMMDDLQKQIADIEKEIEQVKEALEERQRVIDEEIQKLNSLKNEQEAQEREIERLNKLIDELKKRNAQYDSDIKDLEEEKRQLEDRVAELELTLSERQRELDESEQQLRDKDNAIQWQLNRLKEKNKGKPKAPQGKSGGAFVVQKGDLLDEMFGRYINETGCKVPIKKLGGGYYLFGTRKIYAKILNGKLVIRVGGGYMVITEFIATYADVELAKLEKLREQGIDPHAPEDDKAPTGRGSAAAKRSPKNNKNVEGVINMQGDVAMSGTFRQKKMTQAQLDKMKAKGAARQLK